MQQPAFVSGGGSVTALVRPRPTRRARLRTRRERDRAEYERRKANGLCTKCGVDSPDDQLCPGCSAAKREARAASATRQRAARRKKKQCARCGLPSPERYECTACAIASGREPRRSSAVGTAVGTARAERPTAIPISHGAIHAARRAAATAVDADGRTRYHGRGKRGHPSRADVDAFDVRIMRTELDRAEVALARYHDAANQDRPRIQRDEPLREALGHLDLVSRQIEEFVERAMRRLR